MSVLLIMKRKSKQRWSTIPQWIHSNWITTVPQFIFVYYVWYIDLGEYYFMGIDKVDFENLFSYKNKNCFLSMCITNAIQKTYLHQNKIMISHLLQKSKKQSKPIIISRIHVLGYCSNPVRMNSLWNCWPSLFRLSFHY